LGEQVEQLESVGCRMLHFDVMDGHFRAEFHDRAAGSRIVAQDYSHDD